MHTAEGDTHIFASESTRDRLSEAGLTYARRAIEAENRRFHISLELEHCEILDDSVLYRIETEMVLVKHLLCVLQVKIVIRDLAPWQVEHEVDVIVLYAVVRRARVITFELCHLLLEDLLHSRAPELFLSTGAELRKFLNIIHSELFLDGLELVVEIIFPLLLVDLCLDLLVDFLLDLLEFELGIEHRKKLHGSGAEVSELKEFHLVHEILCLDGCCDEVHEELEAVYALESSCRLARNHRRHAYERSSLFLQRFCDHTGLGIVLRCEIIEIAHASEHVRVILYYRIDFESFEALEDGGDGTVRHLQSLYDLGDRSEIIQILLARVLYCQVVLRNCADEGIVLFRIFYKADGFITADGDRIDRSREKNGISQRQNRKIIRQFALIDLHQSLSLHYRNNAYFRTM